MLSVHVDAGRKLKVDMSEDNIIDKYTEELNKDTTISMLNVKDVQMMLPSIKHKWVARAINHKVQLRRYEDLLVKARDKELYTLSNNQPVVMSKATLMGKVDEQPVIIKIKKKIEELKLILEYMEKVEKIFSSMTYDIRNLTDIMKMEIS